MKKNLDKSQFGDFQTPFELAEKVVQLLITKHKIKPDIIIEPSCGKGAFIQAALKHFDNSTLLGFDINEVYIQDALSLLVNQQKNRNISINVGDFFQIDWLPKIEKYKGNLLILGNPPWVTSSELGSLNSNNVPSKSNFQLRRGIDAITGSGNFDISEWMLLQNIDWLSNREGTIAVLCKYSVARKVMKQIRITHKHLFSGYIYTIDAKHYFDASVEACLFVLTKEDSIADYEVYEELSSTSPSYIIGERDGYLLRDITKYSKWKHLIGKEQEYIWRSGLKHDCSKVMELEPIDGSYKNGFGEIVDLEDNYIYPFLKSSDIGNSRIDFNRKTVIVTQKFVGEDTSMVKNIAPKIWQYLESYSNLLNGRKSSIYKGKPAYSIFGVGDYTFKSWKIAISGLYKKLNFCLIPPMKGKPVIFDDTVNFLSFDSENEARFIYKLITSKIAEEFYSSMIFWDEKRPITTDI
ncbi:TPA: hypothetical protein ACVO2K_003183, partial [Legionella pneumophila]